MGLGRPNEREIATVLLLLSCQRVRAKHDFSRNKRQKATRNGTVGEPILIQSESDTQLVSPIPFSSEQELERAWLDIPHKRQSLAPMAE
jgi:hypothetical protein